MSQPGDRQSQFELLKQERPRFHSAHDGSISTQTAAHNWALNQNVLDWLYENLQPGFRTLETGCGYSTVTFAINGCKHDVVSPFSEEHHCIKDWCKAHGISTESLVFHPGRSERILPDLETSLLNLVLIDGDHAVPLPLIDYFYVADSIVKGGLLLVDDVQLPSVQQLNGFLDTEKPRWEFVRQIDRTRVYRKLVDGKVTGLLWREQPYSGDAARRRKPNILGRAFRKINRLLRND